MVDSESVDRFSERVISPSMSRSAPSRSLAAMCSRAEEVFDCVSDSSFNTQWFRERSVSSVVSGDETKYSRYVSVDLRVVSSSESSRSLSSYSNRF